LHPVPIEHWSKKPIGKAWGAEFPTRDKLIAVFDRHKGAGVGIALGPLAGKVDFEIDDQDEAAALLDRIDLPPTLGWRSARGQHRLFLWDRRLEGLAGSSVVHLGGAELRLGQEGKQLVSVCPPTVGADHRCRHWLDCWEVSPFPECLLKELDRPQPRREPRPNFRTANGSRYADAALRYEVRNVAGAREGTRNVMLNKAAFSLGGLVAVGLLSRESVEDALFEAALVAGLGEAESAATIKSGLDAGVKKPRRL
jgi:hypothetical protein